MTDVKFQGTNDTRPESRWQLSRKCSAMAFALTAVCCPMGDNANADDRRTVSSTDKETDRTRLVEAISKNSEAGRIRFDETMIGAWNEQGAAAIVFDPQTDDSDIEPDDAVAEAAKDVIYRWRLNVGTEDELTGTGALQIGAGPQSIKIGRVSIVIDRLSGDRGTVIYDPEAVCVHPLDRTFFEKRNRGRPSESEPYPAVDLTRFLLPDEEIQDWFRQRQYRGQTTVPAYPRHPYSFRVHYDDNDLVVATPDGVALFCFIESFYTVEVDVSRLGWKYFWRYVSADGMVDDSGIGEVCEAARNGRTVVDKTLRYLAAGPIHVLWARNDNEAGWVTFDPAWHSLWLVEPETRPEEPERDANSLRRFAFGPRPLAEEAVSMLPGETDN